MPLWRLDQHNPRGTEAKVELGQLRVPETDPCESRRYSWPEIEEAKLLEGACWNRSWHQENQQGVYLCRLMI